MTICKVSTHVVWMSTGSVGIDEDDCVVGSATLAVVTLLYLTLAFPNLTISDMIVGRFADASLATVSDSSGKHDHANAIVESAAKKAKRHGQMTNQMTYGSKTHTRKASSRSPRTVAQLLVTSCT